MTQAPLHADIASGAVVNRGARLEWLDLFRGVAALVVVGYHFLDYLKLPFMHWGFIAVQAFFVLSGLVLGLRYSEQIRSGMPFSRFAAARLAKLYPMCFLSGCLVLVLNALDVSGTDFVPGANASPLDVFLLTSLTWAVASTPAPAWPANSPVWSLWAELASNAVWFVSLRHGRAFVRFVGIGCVVVMLVLTAHARYAGNGPNAGLVERLMSLVTATAWFSIGYWIALKRRPPTASLKLVLGLLLACIVASEAGGTRAWLPSLGIAVVCAAVLHHLYLLAPPGAVCGWVARWLGKASYPLYLIHAPASRLLPREGGTFQHWAWFVLVIGGATVVATALNETVVPWVQRRSTAWASKLAPAVR